MLGIGVCAIVFAATSTVMPFVAVPALAALGRGVLTALLVGGFAAMTNRLVFSCGAYR
jgi:hypothetical protein